MKRWKVGKRDWRSWALGSTLIVLFLAQLLIVPHAVLAATAFDVTVAPVNVAPSFTKGTNQTVLEDCGSQTASEWATSMSAGPADEAGQTLDFVVTNDNNALFSVQPTVAANGTLTYMPATNGNGMATVTVSLHDNGGTADGGVNTSTPQTFTITVTPVNDAPVAVPDSYTTAEDTVLIVAAPGVLANDTDVDGQTLTAAIDVSNYPRHGTAILQPDGSLKYTPHLNYCGPDVFKYRASDGVVQTTLTTVSLQVTAVNDPPYGITLSKATIIENLPAGTQVGYFVTQDIEGNVGFTYSLSGPGAAVLAMTNGNYLVTTQALDHETQPAYTLHVRTTDAGGLWYETDFVISVTDVNDAPTGITLANSTIRENQPAGTLIGSLGTADADAGDTHTYMLVPSEGEADNALFAVSGAELHTATVFDYETRSAYSIRVRTTDSGGLLFEEQSIVMVANVNEQPTASAQSLPTTEDTPCAITLSGSDPDGDPLAFAITIGPLHGVLSGSAPNLVYTPLVDYPPGHTDASDSFTFVAADGSGLTSSPATVSITIASVNDGPAFGPVGSQTLTEDTSAAILLVASDADGDPVTYGVAGGNVDTVAASISGDWLQLMPAPNYNTVVPLMLTVTASDSHGAMATEPIMVSTSPTNDPPSFERGPDQVVFEDCGPRTVSDWATAISRGPANESFQCLTFIVSGNTNPGLFSGPAVVASDGTLTYTPAPDANGTAVVTMILTDDGTAGGAALTTAPQTFTITITPVNDVPSFTKGAGQTVLEDCGAQTVSGWATSISAGPADESGQALNFIVTNDNTTLFSTQPAVAANGTLTYTLALNRNGSATVTICIHDDGGTANASVDTSTPQTFTITVNPDNDPPVDTYTVTYTAGANGTISGTSPQTVNQGASGTVVTAVPNRGYHFVSWSDGVATVARTDTNVTANINATASFAVDTFAITASAGANGAIDPSGSVSVNSVNSGSDLTFTINPGTGYHVQGVLVDGSSMGAVTSYTFTNLTENHTIAATFAINPITISTYTLTYTAGANGVVTGTTPQTVNQGASGTTMTAIPNTGYHFVTWSDGVLTAVRTDANVTANISVTAAFVINTYTLTVNVSGSGSVARNPGQISYAHGTSVQLMATPATGWHFVGWSGDLAGSTNPATITMDASKTVTATYAPPMPRSVSGRTMVLTIGSKTMTVDGARVALDAPAALVEDRTLVPLRALVEHLGGTISWNAKTRQVTLKARGTTIVLTIGKSTALVNDMPLAIDPKNGKVVPLISSGRTMLPLHFVAENLGLQVEWNAEARTITIAWEDWPLFSTPDFTTGPL